MGFVVNRVLSQWLTKLGLILGEGVSAEEIDEAMKLVQTIQLAHWHLLTWPDWMWLLHVIMGVLNNGFLVILNTVRQPLIVKNIEAGKLGRKTEEAIL